VSVNRIRQSHASQAEAVQNVNSQKPAGATTKANAVDGEIREPIAIPHLCFPKPKLFGLEFLAFLPCFPSLG
jgi:hypothetical protein